MSNAGLIITPNMSGEVSTTELVGEVSGGLKIEAIILNGMKGDPFRFEDFTPEQLAALDTHYTHDQIAASKEWTVNHNLNKYPSVMVVDTANTVVIGDIVYVSTNQLIIKFSSAFSGKAYMN